MISDARVIESLLRDSDFSLLLEQATHATPSDLRRIRNRVGMEQARWLMEFAAVLPKAQEKFGLGLWLGTRRSVQQSTDLVTASYKASRFPRGAEIYDICCGIGGDARALRQRGPVVAIDNDAAIAVMAAANLGQPDSPPGSSGPTACPTVVLCQTADDWSPSTASAFLHIDPDRRPTGKRTTDPHHYQPGLETLDRLIELSAGVAVKLAPGAVLPATWQGRCEQEWISYRGSVRQQVAWFGSLANSTGAELRTATAIGDDVQQVTFRSADWQASPSSADRVGDLIIDFDPAIRAAGLSAAFAIANDWQALGEPSGFFTGDSLPDESLAVGYEVLWSGGADLKQIKRAATQLSRRLLEIKVRGSEHRPESLRKKLASKQTRTASEATLLIGRNRSSTYAVIAQRRSAAR